MKNSNTTEPSKKSRQNVRTPEFEQSIVKLALKQPFSKIAKDYGIPVSTVAQIVHKVLDALVMHFWPAPARHMIGIDGPHLKTPRKHRKSV